MKKLSILCVAMAALLLSSCTPTDVNAQDIQGEWESVEFVKNGESVTGSTATINIPAPEDGIYNVNGNDGVNLYSGAFTISGNKIAPVDPAAVANTKMAGPEEAMNFETAFLDFILGENKISMKGDDLIISNGNSKITFKKIADTAEID